MIEIRRNGDGLLEFVLSRAVTREDVQAAMGAVRPRLEAGEPLELLVDISALESLSLAAVATDIRESFRLLPYLGTPIRTALLAERGFLSGLARFEAMFLPGIDLRVFAPDERDKAMDWLSATGEAVS